MDFIAGNAAWKELSMTEREDEMPIMTIEQERLTPTQEDREAAWPFRAECFGHLDHVGWMAGKYDHVRPIQAFARHRLAALKSPPIGGEHHPNHLQSTGNLPETAALVTTSGDVGKLCERLRGHSMALAVNAKYGLDLRSDLTNRDAVSYGELLAEAAARISALEKALEQWKCGSCGGSGIYKNKFMRTPDEHVEEVIECKVCAGKGLSPIAQAALNPTPTEER